MTGPSSNPPYLARYVPILGWARAYRREWLARDLAAGATLGAVMVPVGLAFGQLAGVPMAGLYAGMLPLIVYAVFGSSRQLIIGPDASMAAVVALSIAPLAAGDPARLAVLAGLLALCVGIVCVAAGVLRFGFMADLLAKPVIVGFMHGLAVIILIGQLPKVLGVPAAGETTLAQAANALARVGEAHLPTVAVAAACLAVVLLLPRWVPRAPNQVIALVGAVIAVYAFNLDAHGVAVVGDIPSGLPNFGFPGVSLAEAQTVMALALGVALVAFSDTIVTARGFASRNHYRIDANQELVALGLGNIASGLTQGLPVSGSGSRTAVAESAGSRTQVTSMAAAVTLGAVLVFLTAYLSKLPDAALGAILIAAAWSLCDVREFVRLWRFRGVGFALGVVVLCAVVGLGILEGILLGVVLSLMLVLHGFAFPHDAVLGQLGTEFYDPAFRPQARLVPGVIVYRMSGPLFFANCTEVFERVDKLIRADSGPPEAFVLEASAISGFDLAGCEVLQEIADHLRARGVRFAIAQLRDHERSTLERSGVPVARDRSIYFPTVLAAIGTTRGVGGDGRPATDSSPGERAGGV